MVARVRAGAVRTDLVEVRADGDLDPGVRITRRRGARPAAGGSGQDADGETAALAHTDERLGGGGHHPRATTRQQVIPGAGDPLAEAARAVRVRLASRAHDADYGQT